MTKQERTIEFPVHYWITGRGKIINEESSCIPFMKSFQKDNLKNPNDKVIKEKKINILFDYPLSRPFVETFKSQIGFTRITIVELIINKYKEIYSKEKETTKIRVIPLNRRKEWSNRNRTNGVYGIQCHDFEDLSLNSITYEPNENYWSILVES